MMTMMNPCPSGEANGDDRRDLRPQEHFAMTDSETPLPGAFVHFRDLFLIHLAQILKLDRKPPIHAATLVVLVACETLSYLFERPDDCDMFARDLLSERNVPYEVGKTLFNTLRNNLAHKYATGRIVVGRDEIRPTLNWKGGGDAHLSLIGVQQRGIHLHSVRVEENEDRYFRLSISVEELCKDLYALFKRLEADLRADPVLAERVEANAMAALMGDIKKGQPEGAALEVWREYIRSARWEGPIGRESA